MKPWLMIPLAALLLGGCATDPAFRNGKQLLQEGKVGDGLAQLEKAAKAHPDNLEYRAYLFRQRDAVISQLLGQADSALEQGRYDVADALYRQVLGIDGNNARAQAGVRQVAADRRHHAIVTEATALFAKGDLAGARAKLSPVLAENPRDKGARDLARRIEERQAGTEFTVPRLKADIAKPVTLEFRDASLRSVFEVISKVAGINVIFDKDVRPDLKTTIFVRNTTIDSAIRLLLVTNQLARKVLNENTLLIYPDTPAKRAEYQDMVVKSFYLSHADPKQVLTMIKTLIKTRDVYIDDKLNLVVMRDTPEAVRMAERLVSLADLAEPEVMLDVEVLEVSTTWLRDLGIRYPNQISYSLIGTSSNGQVTVPLSQWKNRDSSLIGLTVNDPAFTINLLQQNTGANLLANPRIRVENHEKAKILIGNRVPVITSTSTSTGFVSESVNYLDVGLKLQVQPSVSLDDTVSMKVALEVSSIAGQVTSKAGTVAYQLGTRDADTTLSLKDGETQVLAGLINNEERKSADKFPGLGDLPIVGRLFSSHNDSDNKTEIVLLITPHIIRNLRLPDGPYAEFAGGTDAAVGSAPLALRQALPPEPEPEPAPAEAPSAVTPAAPAGVATPAPAASSPAGAVAPPGLTPPPGPGSITPSAR